MPSEPAPLPSFDPAVLAQLACPACHGDLRVVSEGLVCASCGRTYPVLDGIPVLVPEQR